MLTPSHIAAGYLVVESTRKWWQKFELSSRQKLGLFGFGIACANLPDLNMFWLLDITDHHRDIFHYPFFWLCVWLAVFVVSLLSRKRLFFFLSVLLGIEVFLHLFLDSWGVRLGVHWLWPFDTREYAFVPLQKDSPASEWWSYYIRSNLMKVEVALWLVTGTVLLGRLKSVRRNKTRSIDG